MPCWSGFSAVILFRCCFFSFFFLFLLGVVVVVVVVCCSCLLLLRFCFVFVFVVLFVCLLLLLFTSLTGEPRIDPLVSQRRTERTLDRPVFALSHEETVQCCKWKIITKIEIFGAPSAGSPRLGVQKDTEDQMGVGRMAY